MDDPWLTHFRDQLDGRLEDVAAAADRLHADLAEIAAEGRRRGLSDDGILSAMTVAMETSRADKPTMARALALYAFRAHGTQR